MKTLLPLGLARTLARRFDATISKNAYGEYVVRAYPEYGLSYENRVELTRTDNLQDALDTLVFEVVRYAERDLPAAPPRTREAIRDLLHHALEVTALTSRLTPTPAVNDRRLNKIAALLAAYPQPNA